MLLPKTTPGLCFSPSRGSFGNPGVGISLDWWQHISRRASRVASTVYCPIVQPYHRKSQHIPASPTRNTQTTKQQTTKRTTSNRQTIIKLDHQQMNLQMDHKESSNEAWYEMCQTEQAWVEYSTSRYLILCICILFVGQNHLAQVKTPKPHFTSSSSSSSSSSPSLSSCST